MVPPIQVCPGSPNTLWGRGRNGELVAFSPHGCYTSLTGRSFSPSAFSVLGLAPGPYPTLWSLEDVSLPC